MEDRYGSLFSEPGYFVPYVTESSVGLRAREKKFFDSLPDMCRDTFCISTDGKFEYILSHSR